VENLLQCLWFGKKLHTRSMEVARKPTAPPSLAQRYGRIYNVVASIPRGAVASYGQVAAMAGLPRRARLVGRALAVCPRRVPWHRVLNAAGRISLPGGSSSYARQVQLLEAEGVEVRNGRVAARHFLRQAGSLDALLWGPDATENAARRPVRRRPR
jgi:methylated-DNA-protein-cysteine methyltransferase-like protein